ncbi:MAG: glycosyltransferase family 2 protein [Candidatus Micrarchaeia archaeon]|jgi:glycosyltransferase involved in cell wall biosynthesis
MGKSIVVIPAHNEEKTISSVVRDAKKYCDVLVVDDSSSDRTGELASASGATVLRNGLNVGYTASLNLGVAEAAKRADNVIIMDADGQHNPAQIPEMISLLDNGADFVLGVRHRKARLAERLFGLLARWRVGVSDPLCGFRGFSSEVFRKVGFYDSIGSIGTQFVFAAKKKGFSITEIDVDIRERKGTPRLFGGRAIRSELMMLKAFAKLFAYDIFGIRLVNPKWK